MSKPIQTHKIFTHYKKKCGIVLIPLFIHFQVDEDLIDDLGEKKR